MQVDADDAEKGGAVVSENEQWYDAEIAPALLAIGKRCEDRGLSFLACVEYDKDKRASTMTIREDAGLAMRMLYFCDRTRENVDAYMINLRRYCGKKGIDINASMYLRDQP